MFGQKLLELDPEEESFQNEGDNDDHANHGEDVEAHEEEPAPVGLCREGVAFHNYVPIVHD